jgi:aldose 1-epimerase
MPHARWTLLAVWMTAALGCTGDPTEQASTNEAGAEQVLTNEAGTGQVSTNEAGSAKAVKLEQQPYGSTRDGVQITQFTLTSPSGLVVRLIDFGALITSIEAPGRDGQKAEITLGFDTLAEYEDNPAYFGCTVGRYANRIAKGRFTLEGVEYELATNNGPNHLHGGKIGFHKRVWNARASQENNAASVTLTYRSPDGEEGYPGNLDVTVVYTLSPRDELTIDYTAETDTPTVVNLTNHAYWNLAGEGSGDVLKHEIAIHADQYLPVDDTAIPTGELAPVEGTPMDLRQSQPIGRRIADVVGGGGGYDHCYVLNGSGQGKLALAATVYEPTSGRVLEILTTEPGIQFYTGNFLDLAGRAGKLDKHHAFCLETQHFPDSPNQSRFPTTVLRPDQTLRSTTVHRFSVRPK